MRHPLVLSAALLAASLVPASAVEVPKLKSTQGTVPASAARGPEAFRPLPLGLGEARLGGELASKVVPVYVLPAEASRPVKLQITAMTAVSAMPELSRMTVTVNDVPIGERQLRSTAKPETLSFDIPPGLLDAGFNGVRISVRHVHRVDCSREGTYELWTQIVPETSGLLLGGSRVEIRELSDLAAVPATASGSTRIRVRLPDERDPVAIGQVARAVQALVVGGHIARPVVEVNPQDSADPGIELVLGDAAEGGGREGSPPRRVQIRHEPSTERVLVIVPGGTSEEIEVALRTLEAAATTSAVPMAAPAGLRGLAAAYGARTTGEAILSLGSLGFATQRFHGRFYRQSGLIQLPADFYSGSYGRIGLRLDAAYGAALGPAAKFNVRVNGAVVGSVPLQNQFGDVLRKRLIQLPLAVFKPGLNAVELEAETTALADAECNAASQTNLRDRLVVADTSELEIPELARIATFPSLPGMITGAVAPASEKGILHVFLPNATTETVEAALGLVAKTAFLSGRIDTVSFAFDAPDPRAAHVLAIGTVAGMPASMLSAAGLVSDTLQTEWQQPPVAIGTANDALRLPVQIATAEPDALGYALARRVAVRGLDHQFASETTGTIDPLAIFDKTPHGSRPGVVERVAHEISSSIAQLRALGLRGAFLSHVSDPVENGPIVTPASRILIAQSATPVPGQPLWRERVLPDITSATVILAPTAELLRNGLQDLVSTSLFQQFAGDTATLDQKGVIRSRPAKSTWFVPTQVSSTANLRLIVAGWLSQNVMVYVSALAALALLLTGSSYLLVKRSGVRE
jgi:cellulose synthase operon protein B